jgi:hypothetical protein
MLSCPSPSKTQRIRFPDPTRCWDLGLDYRDKDCIYAFYDGLKSQEVAHMFALPHRPLFVVLDNMNNLFLCSETRVLGKVGTSEGRAVAWYKHDLYVSLH